MTRLYISIQTPDGQTEQIHGETISKISKRFRNVDAFARLHKQKLIKAQWTDLGDATIGSTKNGITNAQYYGALKAIK
mgnify:CR=1 FL=1